MGKKIAIIVKNCSDKVTDVGDINGIALYRQLIKLGETIELIHFSGKCAEKKSTHIFRALFNRYDVVYVSSPKRYFGMFSLIFAFLQLKPLYISIFDKTLEPFIKNPTNIIFKKLVRAKYFRPIAVSKYQKKLIDSIFDTKAPVLPPCLLTFGYNKKYKRKNPPTVLFAGSTDNTKRGLNILINACQKLAKKYKGLELVILNKFEQDNRTSVIKIDKSKYDFKITEKGYTDNISEDYKKAWVYALPFQEDKYIPPIPFTFLEALSFCTPVISTKYEQFQELLPKSCMVPKANHKILAIAIDRILKTRKTAELDRLYFPQSVAKKFITITKSPTGVN